MPASKHYMVQYYGNEQAERLAKGANYNVPLQSVVQQCLANLSPIVIASVTADLSRTLVSCCMPYTSCVSKPHSTPSQAVYTQVVSAVLSPCRHLITTHAAHTAQGLLWVGHLGPK